MKLTSEKSTARKICQRCNDKGGYWVNPDYPMGDCGAREFIRCMECNPPRKPLPHECTSYKNDYKHRWSQPNGIFEDWLCLICKRWKGEIDVYARENPQR